MGIFLVHKQESYGKRRTFVGSLAEFTFFC